MWLVRKGKGTAKDRHTTALIKKTPRLVRQPDCWRHFPDQSRDREGKEIGSSICCNTLDIAVGRGKRAPAGRASATITTKKTLTCSW